MPVFRTSRTQAPRFPHRLEQPLLALHSSTDSKAYLAAATTLLAAAVPHDITYVLFHYWPGVNNECLVYDTSGRVFDDPLSLRRHHELNPATPIIAAHPGLKLISISECLPTEEAALASPFYHEIMVPLNFRWAVALMFWTPKRDTVQCCLALHRPRAQGDFSLPDIRLLRKLHTVLDANLRRVLKLQAERSAARSFASELHRLPVSIVLLDWNLRATFQTTAAREICDLWQSGEAASVYKHARADFHLPDEVRAACAQMKGEWEGATHTAREARKSRELQRISPPLKAAISITACDPLTMERPCFVIHFSHGDQPHALLASDANLERLARLTATEQRMAQLVCEGQSNQEIADSLHHSVGSVKVALHVIFQKLEVPSRARLIALLR